MWHYRMSNAYIWRLSDPTWEYLKLEGVYGYLLPISLTEQGLGEPPRPDWSWHLSFICFVVLSVCSWGFLCSILCGVRPRIDWRLRWAYIAKPKPTAPWRRLQEHGWGGAGSTAVSTKKASAFGIGTHAVAWVSAC